MSPNFKPIQSNVWICGYLVLKNSLLFKNDFQATSTPLSCSSINLYFFPIRYKSRTDIVKFYLSLNSSVGSNCISDGDNALPSLVNSEAKNSELDSVDML